MFATSALSTSNSNREISITNWLFSLGQPLPVSCVVQRLSHPYLESWQRFHYRSENGIYDFEMKS